MRFIPDASVSLCWFLPEQATAGSTALLIQAKQTGIVVPIHWHLEVVNKLGWHVRIGKLEDWKPTCSSSLDSMWTQDLCRSIPRRLASMKRHRLTAYDAAYLELALRSGLPLATYDKALIASAALAGVPLLP